MDPHTPPDYRYGQPTPPQSTKPTLRSPHIPNGEPIHAVHRVWSMPTSDSMYGFSHISSPATGSQNQEMATYFNGAQVASPPAMAASPYLQPSQQNRQEEDPEYVEYKRWKRLQKLEEQRRNSLRRTDRGTPDRRSSQQRQGFDQPQNLPRQRSPPQQQRSPPQQGHSPPPQRTSPPQQQTSPQQQSSTEQQRLPPLRSQSESSQTYHSPYLQEEELAQEQELQDQYGSPHQSSYPLPMPLMQQFPQRSQTGSTARTISMDEYGRRYHPQNYMAAPQFPQPHVYSYRPGHTYGKVTVTGDAKVLMGNGVGPRSSGQERQHNFGDVVASNTTNVYQGDYPVEAIPQLFARPPSQN